VLLWGALLCDNAVGFSFLGLSVISILKSKCILISVALLFVLAALDFLPDFCVWYDE
jgi:hypothetical protein